MKFVEKLNLSKEKKSDLIKTLLIVVSILVAIKPHNIDIMSIDIMSVVFMVFIFSSIYYYIIIQKDSLKPSYCYSFIVLIIAATFSTLVNVNLFVSFGSTLISFSPLIGRILYLSYFFLLTAMLWAALVKR